MRPHLTACSGLTFQPLSRQMHCFACVIAVLGFGQPSGKPPPPASFKCDFVQISYVNLYLHLIRDASVCEVAAALHAERLVIVASQRFWQSTGRLAQASMD